MCSEKEIGLAGSFEYFSWLRDCFFDEIPKEVLHGHGNFKARRGWWQGLVGGLERWLTENPTERISPEVELFITYYTSDTFHGQELTTCWDIDWANYILDRVLRRVTDSEV